MLKVRWPKLCGWFWSFLTRPLQSRENYRNDRNISTDRNEHQHCQGKDLQSKYTIKYYVRFLKEMKCRKIENIINLGSIKLETSIHNTNISYITISFIPLDSRFIICACKFMNDHYIMMFALWLSKIQWLWKQKYCDILPSNDKCTEAAYYWKRN